ncbi:MAG: hypothetical protein JKY54_11720 [Flavobacteriales bacterium]|nr:hypothetical protein [Flavobacteriales bacterium]
MKLLNVQISEIEGEMESLINLDQELKKKITYLTSIPGVSTTTATIVIAETRMNL